MCKTNRIIALILIVVILLPQVSGLSVNANSEASGKCGDNLRWELDVESKTLIISGTGPMYNFTNTIGANSSPPPWLTDYHHYFGQYSNGPLENIILLNGVTTIGNNAFVSVDFKHIDLPDSLISIGEYAFNGCDGIDRITIPASVNSIECGAFDGNVHGYVKSIIVLNENCNFYPYSGTLPQVLYGFSGSTTEQFAKEYGHSFIPLNNCELQGYEHNYEWSINLEPSLWTKGELKGICRNCGKTSHVDLPCFYSNSFINEKDYYYEIVGAPTESTPGTVRLFWRNTDYGSFFFDTNLPVASREWNNQIKWLYYFGIGKLIISGNGTITEDCLPWNMEWTDIGKYDVLELIIEPGITGIDDNVFKECSKLRSVSLPESITQIGKSAFQSCSGIKALHLPKNLTKISDYAFLSCNDLETVDLPQNLQSIGIRSFGFCSSLSEVLIPENVNHIETSENKSSFYDCTSLRRIIIEDNNPYYSSDDLGVIYSKNGEELLMCPGGLQGQYIIPDGVSAVMEDAFEDCKKLTEVYMADSVLSIGNGAFSGSGIQSIHLSKNLKEIGNGAFMECALKTITLPNSIETLGTNIFSDCESLTFAVFPDHLEDIGSMTFLDCSALTDVHLPKSLKHIESYSFARCTSLKQMELSESVLSVGRGAFQSCTNLEQLIINNAACDIDMTSGVLGDPKTTTIIGNSGSTAEEYANQFGYRFVDSSSRLTYSVTYDANGGSGAPASTLKNRDKTLKIDSQKPEKTYILSYDANGGSVSPSFEIVTCTFQNWNSSPNGYGINYYPGTLYTANADVTLYAQWDNPTINTLPTPTRAYYSFDGWYTAPVEGNKVTNATFLTKDMTIYAHWVENEDSKCGTSLRWSFEETTNSLIISGSGLMQNWSTSKEVPWSEYTGIIHNISLPATIKNIGEFAFSNCNNLVSVTIPNGVTSIGNNAFEDCKELTDILIPNSVLSIGARAFQNCNKLNPDRIPNSVVRIGEAAFFGCSSITNLEIPDSVRTIDKKAFSNCSSLLDLSIGNNLRVIGNWCFRNCSKLTSVTIPSSVTEIGIGAFSGCGLASTIITSKNCSFNDEVSVEGYGETLGNPNSTTVYSYKDSTAEEYSQKNGYSFIAISENTYLIIYNANGGTGAPAAQEKTNGINETLSTTCPSKAYTITYDVNGGDVFIPPKTIDCAFINWNTAPNGEGVTYRPNDLYTNDANLTLYAQWSDPIAGELSKPTRLNYIFDGWYTAANGGSLVTSSTTIIGDTIVFAHWISTYTISFDANGGTGAPSAQRKTEGEELILSSLQPMKSHTITFNANGGEVSSSSKIVSCSFQNWNTAINGSGTAYNSGAPYIADADVTMFAQWKDPTAGTLPTPTRSDYAFEGWYSTAEDGYLVTSDTIVTSDLTIYAHWTPVFSIIYDANGGFNAPASQIKPMDEVLQLSLQEPTKSYTITYNANEGSVDPSFAQVNCTFQNWDTSANGDGTTYVPGASFSSNNNLTLYAQWANPIVGDMPIPSRTDYYFDGWYTAIDDGELVTSSSIVTDDLTVFAHWTVDESIKCGPNLTWRFDENRHILFISGSGQMQTWRVSKNVPWHEYVDSIQIISLPAGLTSIGDYAFSNCNNLISVAIPNGVISIGKNAFNHCGNLTSVFIPDSVKRIERTAFEFCNALTEIIIGSGVEQIEEGILRNCSALNYVTVLSQDCIIYPNSSTTLGDPTVTTIIGLKDSTAEQFAKQSGYTFKELDAATRFSDVATDKYYSNPITWAVYRGITNGTSSSTFSPEAVCTRAQVVTFLWRATGRPEPLATDNPFLDVNTGTYYYKAVLWAVENGITMGTSSTTFSPDSSCTRAQVVTFLYRAAKSPEPDGSANPFNDIIQSAYYFDAVLWAVNHSPQITNGTSTSSFSPDQVCTRGQIVTFLYRAIADEILLEG